MLPTRRVVQYHRRVRNQVFFRNLAGFSDFWDILDKGTVPDRLNQSGLPTVRYSSTRSLSRPTVPDYHHVILSYPFLHRLERFHTKLQKPSLFPRFFFNKHATLSYFPPLPCSTFIPPIFIFCPRVPPSPALIIPKFGACASICACWLFGFFTV